MKEETKMVKKENSEAGGGLTKELHGYKFSVSKCMKKK